MDSFDCGAVFERSPNAYMVLDRDLRFVAANPAYLQVTATRLEDLLGVAVLDAFPNDPGNPDNPGASRLRASLHRVLETGETDTLAAIAYQVAEESPAGRTLRERWWSATHTPLVDEQGHVTHILQHTVEITALPALQTLAAQAASDASAAAVAAVLAQVHADVLRRAREVEASNARLELERRELRRIIDQAPGFVAVLRGKDHVFELVNPAYYQLVGHRDVIGSTIREAMPDVADQGYFELLDRVRETGEPYVGTSQRALIQREPGVPAHEILVDVIFQPILGPDGRVSGIFVQGHDLTERRGLELERERLATIVEQSGDYIGVATVGGAMTYLNPAGQALLGLPAHALAGVAEADVIHGDDRDVMRDTIYPSLRALGRWDGEVRFRHHETGEAIPVHYNGFSIIDPHTHAVVAFASVSRDLRALQEYDRSVAGLRAAESAVRARFEETQLAYGFLADAVPDQIWTAHPSGLLTHVNERVTTYFGRSAEQMLADGWEAGLHPDDRAGCDERWASSLATGEPYECEFRLLRASDRTYRWHISRALAQRDAGGAIVTWHGSNTDIDDLKRTERERDQLIVALSDSNRELDQFAYVASHDLKSPLRGINSIAQWIEEDLGDTMPDETRGHLKVLRGRVARMEALVDGVLNYSRAGRSGGSRQRVDLGALMKDVVDLLVPPPAVTIDIAPDLPWLETEPMALQQVLMNLVGNAIKHGGRDDLTVRVAAVERVEGAPPSTRRMVRFTVTDDGAGIEPRFHDRIWDIFQVLQPRDEVEGSGIGLSVVKKLVLLHGGLLGVESELGAGATFWFTWPKIEA